MPDRIVTFGEFRLDPLSGHLYHRGQVVPLAPKSFALLQCLVGHAEQLVSKQQLLATVWPGVFVSDAVLKGTIRELRKALGDDSQQPRYIETAHRRGYRFMVPVTASEPAATRAATAPRVQYARSGNVNIAYQVIGSGPIDLVFVMGWVSHLEYFWNQPSFARFLTRLSESARLILFDKRGTGLSDPVPVSELPSLDARLDDVRAVMDAARSDRAVLMGVSEGGPLCSLFAATYPEKTEALIMVGSYARRLRDDDYPWGPTPEDHEKFCQTIIDEWGGPVGIEERAPSLANDPAFREWWAAYLRMGASPGAAVALTRMNAAIDIRDVLPSIRVPTLVLHRADDRCLKVDEGRFLASRIPDAQFVELPGSDHLPFTGDQDRLLDAVEAFISQRRAPHSATASLGTVVAMQAGGSAAVLDLLRRMFERQIELYRGVPLSRNGVFAGLFDAPGRAVQCAQAIAAMARQSRIEARLGVHIGEFDAALADAPLLSAAAVIAAACRDHEVNASRTVIDLLAGLGLRFEDRGRVSIEGRMVPIFLVQPPH